jgi:hypothetical protein
MTPTMAFTPLLAATGYPSPPRPIRYSTTTPFASPMLTDKQPYQVLFSSAVREGNTYKYENVVVPGSLPWHPNPGKSALLCVTTSGVLKLFFSHNSNKMEESTVELENIDLSDDRITHASLTSDRSKSQHRSVPSYCALVRLPLTIFRRSPNRNGNCIQAAQGRPRTDGTGHTTTR